MKDLVISVVVLVALAAAAAAGDAPKPLPTLPALAEPEYRADVGQGVTIEFAHIRAGKFIIGSPVSEIARRDDESIRHQVVIGSPFFVSRTEITQLQFEMITHKNPSTEKGGHYPVHNVTWTEASEFCKKLTARERSASRLPASEEIRLPTEAEWEWACRAGTKSDEKYRFSFGGLDDDLDQYGWHLGNSGEKPHVVGLKKPNPWGLFDVHGNVWEWCLDWYADRYGGAPQTDPRGPATGKARVLRGGSYAQEPSYCRSASRFSAYPDTRSPMYGFRVVRALLPTSVAGKAGPRPTDTGPSEPKTETR